MFELFHLDVAKIDLGCCIRCNDNIRMLQAYVFKCFKHMFQVFHLDVAYVAMAIHAYFKYFTYFRHMLQVTSGCCKSRSGCCICLIWLYTCFKRIFQVFIFFRRILQVFYMYVAKVDLVLHMLQWHR
jgi:hypothetical protein